MSPMKKLPILLVFFLPFSLRSQDSLMKLWYQQPAGEKWVNALPVGNGRIGAMVFGNPAEERIQLNEQTLWSGGPRDPNRPEALEHLDEVRKLLLDGKVKPAEEIAQKFMTGPRPYPYQTLGDLKLSFA